MFVQPCIEQQCCGINRSGVAYVGRSVEKVFKVMIEIDEKDVLAGVVALVVTVIIWIPIFYVLDYVEP